MSHRYTPRPPCKVCGRPSPDDQDTCSDACAIVYLTETFTLWPPKFGSQITGKA